jgi:cytoskeletal protein CcmA (bactofilin family)
MFDKRKDSNQEGPKAHFDAGLNDLSANKAAAQNSGRAAVIGPRIRINGDVSGDENLIIEGQVEGKVNLGEFRVDVGASGQVKADIVAKVVKVDGAVHGDIHGSEKVIISRTGNVRGNIKAPRMTLEDGAKFKGSIDMDPGEAPKAAPQKKLAENPTAPAKPASNGQGHILEKTNKEPGLPLKGN